MSLFLATSLEPLYQIENADGTFGATCSQSDAEANINNCKFAGYGGDKWYQVNQIYLQILNLFLGLWSLNWVIALGEMTLAGGFASFYWAFKKPKDIPAFPIAGALWRGFRYHIGTLAFGALIITIIQMIRICLEYIDRKLKGSENAVAKAILCCLKCCMWCLEKCMRAINKNAYIVTAIYGYHFCKSCCEALGLIMRNALRTAVLSGVTFFIIFLGKVLVVLTMGGLSWAFFYGPISGELDKLEATLAGLDPALNTTVVNTIGAIEKPNLNYYWMPMLVIIFGSYLIATTIFNVYSMAIDTIYICFLEDMERNDGSPERPYFATKSLMKVMNKKNKKISKE